MRECLLSPGFADTRSRPVCSGWRFKYVWLAQLLLASQGFLAMYGRGPCG